MCPLARATHFGYVLFDPQPFDFMWEGGLVACFQTNLATSFCDDAAFLKERTRVKYGFARASVARAAPADLPAEAFLIERLLRWRMGPEGFQCQRLRPMAKLFDSKPESCDRTGSI